MEINTISVRFWDYTKQGELVYQTWITNPELVKPSNPDQSPFRRQREWDNFGEEGAFYYFRKSQFGFWWRLKCIRAKTGEWCGDICLYHDPTNPNKSIDLRIPSNDKWWYQMTSWQVRGKFQTDKAG